MAVALAKKTVLDRAGLPNGVSKRQYLPYSQPMGVYAIKKRTSLLVCQGRNTPFLEPSLAPALFGSLPVRFSDPRLLISE